MRNIIVVVVLCLLASPALAQTCNTSLDGHVYNPDRLQPQNGKAKGECMTLTGTLN